MLNKNNDYDRFAKYNGGFVAYGKLGWGVNFSEYRLRAHTALRWDYVDAAKNRVN